MLKSVEVAARLGLSTGWFLRVVHLLYAAGLPRPQIVRHGHQLRLRFAADAVERWIATLPQCAEVAPARGGGHSAWGVPKLKFHDGRWVRVPRPAAARAGNSGSKRARPVRAAVAAEWQV